MYASVGDEGENAEQIELGKSLKVQVSWSVLLSSVGVGEKLRILRLLRNLGSTASLSHYRFINSIKERLGDEMPSML